MNKHIDYSINMVKRAERLALALNPEEGFFLGFSGGKDSQVLLDIVKRAGVKYRAVYSVTSNDPPENVYFIRKNYPTVIFSHPKKNFFKLIEAKGLPTIHHRFCCSYLKENLGAGNVVLTGVRAEESIKRSKYNEIAVKSTRKEHADRTRTYSLEQIEENEHKCIKGKDSVLVYPLLHWTEKQIWQYIHDNQLPINPCYDKFHRVGCMFCPFSSREQLSFYEKHYPKFKHLFIQSLDVYLHKRTWTDKSGLTTAEEYYDWWKSKEKLSTYIAKSHQLTMNI